MARILIVDDEDVIRDLLARQIAHLGLGTADTVGSVEAAMTSLLQTEYDVVLTDVRMPNRQEGLDLLERIRPLVERTTPCVVITGFSQDPDLILRAMRLGASDYVGKPWTLDTLHEVLTRALDRRRDLLLLRHEDRELRRRVEESAEELRRTYDGVLIGFAAMLEGKDETTASHCQRLAANCRLLADRFSEFDDGAARRDLELGAMLHDIGKYRIPDRILTKDGPLTTEELKVMRLHPDYGAEFVSRIPFLAGARDVVLCHHEKWDGTGYPRKLRGEDIPLSARLFMVTDAFDAITSRRPYKPQHSLGDAILRIRAGSGTHFDPRVVAAFESVSDRLTYEAREPGTEPAAESPEQIPLRATTA
jgi:putative two-component system response regulator